jgi:competence protein ComEC
MLVDAGGSYEGGFDVGELVVAPYLWSQGIGAVEVVAASHPHPDHTGGVPAILRGFRVGQVWEGVAPRSDRGYEAFDSAVEASGTSRLCLAHGHRQGTEGVNLTVRGPTPPGQRPKRTRNDDSVVLEVRFGAVSFLLAGDVEAAGEARLTLREAAVLKVPHHGSRSSSTEPFVRSLVPRIALISAGYKNRFGHPDPGVVTRYLRAGARVLKTSEDGAVTVSTDGRRLWTSTYREGREEVVR